MPGNPVKLSAAEAQAPTAPPTLGENTAQVLQGLLGYPAERLATLRASGAIA